MTLSLKIIKQLSTPMSKRHIRERFLQTNSWQTIYSMCPISQSWGSIKCQQKYKSCLTVLLNAISYGISLSVGSCLVHMQELEDCCTTCTVDSTERQASNCLLKKYRKKSQVIKLNPCMDRQRWCHPVWWAFEVCRVPSLQHQKFNHPALQTLVGKTDFEELSRESKSCCWCKLHSLPVELAILDHCCTRGDTREEIHDVLPSSLSSKHGFCRSSVYHSRTQKTSTESMAMPVYLHEQWTWIWPGD